MSYNKQGKLSKPVFTFFFQISKYKTIIMNNIWHYLREFESKEIIKRFILKKYNYNISTEKAIEINSAFIQGREYFTSSQNADISVRPLLLYYGLMQY